MVKSSQVTSDCEGRRLAAARVKAQIRKDRKLPGYKRHKANNKKRSSSAKSSPCQVKHEQPWNDRFSKDEKENIS